MNTPHFRHNTALCTSNCQICLNDHITLGEWLYKITNTNRKYADILCEFRKYLDNVLCVENAEVNGWLSPEYQTQDIYDSFIEWWTN